MSRRAQTDPPPTVTCTYAATGNTSRPLARTSIPSSWKDLLFTFLHHLQSGKQCDSKRSHLVLNRPCKITAVLLLLILSAVISHADISAVDGRGKRVTLPAPPKRIVSLSPGTTEMLFAIGLKGRIVADTAYCDFPEEAKHLPHIGDVSISSEKVLAQRPDLIVASGSANRTAIQALERYRIPIFVVDPTTFDETYSALRMLGAITGQGKQTEQVVSGMKAGLMKAQAAVPKGAHPKVLWIVQDNPLIVVGAHSFMDDLITMAGALNTGKDAGNGWPTMSAETVLRVKPDVILTGRETAEAVKRRPVWRRLPAVEKGRVLSLSSEEAVRPGPRLVIALQKLIRALYGPAEPPR